MKRIRKNYLSCILSLSLYIIISTGAFSDVTSDLVAHWPMEGDATDIVGGWDGEVGSGGPEWVEGRLDQGVALDGSSHITVPGFELTTDTITFVAWIKGWKAADWAGIVGSRTPLATEMIFGDNDTLHYVWNNNTMWEWANGPVIPQDEWAMAALTIGPDAGTAYIYTDDDGLQSAAQEAEHIEQTVGELNIGWVDCCGGTRYFNGIIDEVMIYNRELTEEDILQLATKGLSVEPAGKLAITWGGLK
ncbi:hypothetical protein GF312_03080 [Candidatus Poribacteria bacterium]|nr:hypothetical protein [Candidatus Poribacteria bacterium]